MKKVGIYIHFPFCIKKCSYCDFVSYENISCDVKKQYVDALLYDMKEYCGEEIDTVYLGGGTPTTMEFAEIKRVIDFVFENSKLSLQLVSFEEIVEILLKVSMFWL